MFEMKKWGPLGQLVGVWEGEKGSDVAPADDRTQAQQSPYRERATFEVIPPVDNHEQWLYGLRYSMVAHRLGESNPFHEEVGYWLWDPQAKLVMKTFLIPRGVSVVAGGSAEADSTEFNLQAKWGDSTFGICSNPFLDREFRTVQFDLKVSVTGGNLLRYEQDTQLQILGQTQLFHHTDANLLSRAR